MNEDKQLVKVDPESLIARAIDKGLPVETMEKLLVMRTQLKTEWAREEFFRELAEFQAKCPIINKNQAVVNEKGERKGETRYKYAPLDEIVEKVKRLLKKHGFSYTVKTKQDKDTFTAIVEAHHVAGHTEATEFMVPIDYTAYMNAPQKVGSAQSYAKRYAFCNAFGILTGERDDDAQSQGNVKPKQEREPPAGQDKIADEGWDASAPAAAGPTEEQKELADKRYNELTKMLKTVGLNGKQVKALQAAMDKPEHRYDVTWLEMAITRTLQEIEKQEAVLKANVQGELIEGSEPEIDGTDIQDHQK